MYMVLGLIMLLRGFADAVMMRLQQAWAFNGSEGYLNAHHYDQVFSRPRRHHDLLRGDAVHHRDDEPRHAAADRRPRRRLPLPQQLQPLDDRGRRGHHHVLALRRRVRPDRLARLPAALRHRREPLCRGRLLHLGPSGRRRRDDALRHQPDRDHHQDALPRHDHDAHADLHLDRALREHPHRRRLPGADRDPRAALASTATSAPTSSPPTTAATR